MAPAPLPAHARQDDQIRFCPPDPWRQLANHAALVFSRRVADPAFTDGGVTELGRVTTFVLSRPRQPGRHRSPMEVVSFRGYKAALDPEAGQVVLGGATGCVCAYDLRYRPFPGATGKILDARKRTTVRIGLDLHAAVEAAWTGTARGRGYPEVPAYWLGFPPDRLPPAADTPTARAAALEAVGPGKDGPLLACLRSPGCTITDLDAADDGVHVLFDDTRVAALPRSAVLASWVQVGRTVEPGAPLGDFLPRRRYAGWQEVEGLLGEVDAAWLLREAVQAHDEARDGLVCRRLELAPGQAGKAARVYEDLRHLLGRPGAPEESRIQIWDAGRAGALCWRTGGVRVDLAAVKPRWEGRFGIGLPADEESARLPAGLRAPAFGC